ncbi:hypothetical protein [Megamonas funiformis]|uniref:hypothetical protein n=1 Tax=Megamonas funiformis TaxID=437897 RepID=UPI003F7E8127
MCEIGDDDAASFLISKPIATCYDSCSKIIGNEEKFGLTKAEQVLLNMYYAQHSAKFRDDYYHGKIPEVVKQMFIGINNVVAKAPLNKDKVLYRFCHDEDPKGMKVGDVVNFPYNLTCTNFDWNQAKYKNVYVITPLPNGKTRAHNLYEIYEHGDEKQVDFLRDTSFMVTKVEETKGTPYRKYYLKELSDA